MKKTLVILAVAMTALFCVMLAGCGGSSGGGEDLSDSQFTGTWNAVSMSIGDESEPFDETCIMTLNGDGTGTLDDGEESSEFTWELTDEGFKTSGDMKMKFVDNGDGTISGKILGTNLNFEKQAESNK